MRVAHTRPVEEIPGRSGAQMGEAECIDNVDNLLRSIRRKRIQLHVRCTPRLKVLLDEDNGVMELCHIGARFSMGSLRFILDEGKDEGVSWRW